MSTLLTGRTPLSSTAGSPRARSRTTAWGSSRRAEAADEWIVVRGLQQIQQIFQPPARESSRAGADPSHDPTLGQENGGDATKAPAEPGQPKSTPVEGPKHTGAVGGGRMITHYFIDRPIFATVVSVVIALAGGIALVYLPIANIPRSARRDYISIGYPVRVPGRRRYGGGADRATGQRGRRHALHVLSMGNDGSYTLTVTFEIGTDLNADLVMVQNRVPLALPVLPPAVQHQGITIRKKTPDILMIVDFALARGAIR